MYSGDGDGGFSFIPNQRSMIFLLNGPIKQSKAKQWEREGGKKTKKGNAYNKNQKQRKYTILIKSNEKKRNIHNTHTKENFIYNNTALCIWNCLKMITIML